MKIRSLALTAPILAVLALPLAGCLSVLPQPVVPTALISLPAERAQTPADPLQADVAVYPPDASRAYSGIDIAVRQSQEMVYLADVRWADAAPHLLQIAVVDSLSKAGGAGHAAPAQLGASVDYDVRWRIVDLSAGYETAPVHAEVEVSLLDATTRRMVAQQTFKAEGVPADKKPRARAAALALAAQSVADQVATFVTRTAKPKT